MNELEKLSKENSWFEQHLTDRLKYYCERRTELLEKKIESLENRVESLEQQQREISLLNTQRNYNENHD